MSIIKRIAIDARIYERERAFGVLKCKLDKHSRLIAPRRVAEYGDLEILVPEAKKRFRSVSGDFSKLQDQHQLYPEPFVIEYHLG